jgi:hypothetical protein
MKVSLRFWRKPFSLNPIGRFYLQSNPYPYGGMFLILFKNSKITRKAHRKITARLLFCNPGILNRYFFRQVVYPLYQYTKLSNMPFPFNKILARKFIQALDDLTYSDIFSS